MQYKNIYQFKIFYIDELGNRNHFFIYSDNADIYSLENLPETTFYIELYYLANKDERAPYKGSRFYLVGTPIAIEELKQEIQQTDISKDRTYLHHMSVAYKDITEMGSSYNIFRKQGKLICLNHLYYQGELAGDIENGKIVRQGAQSKQSSRAKKTAWEKQFENSKYKNGNYIDLE